MQVVEKIVPFPMQPERVEFFQGSDCLRTECDQSHGTGTRRAVTSPSSVYLLGLMLTAELYCFSYPFSSAFAASSFLGVNYLTMCRIYNDQAIRVGLIP